MDHDGVFKAFFGHDVLRADALLQQLEQLDARIADDVYAVLDYAAAVRRRETPAGTGPRSVARQIEQLRSWLQERA